MIVKRVEQGGFKGKGFGSLLDYLEHGDEDTGDKCLHFEYINSVSETDSEMHALLGGNNRSKEPYEHILLSWKEHEKPTVEQAREAVKTALKYIGCDNAQAKWALHDDTDNLHVHVVVIRKDLMNDLAIIKPVFIENNLSASISEIEFKQGWTPEANARYEYIKGVGAVELNDRSQPNDKPRINQKAADFEAHTGEESAVTKAQRMVAPILKDAKDWQSLHAELADNGLSIEARKGGLVLVGFDVPVKLSDINRAYSKSKLEAKIGTFEPVLEQPKEQQTGRVVVNESPALSPDLEVKTYAPDPRYIQYSEAKFEYNKDRHAQVKAFRERQQRERSELLSKAKAERTDLAKDYKYHKFSHPEISITFNAFKSVLAAQQAAEKAELQEKQRLEREQFFSTLPYFPRWQEWLKGMSIEQVKEQQQHFMQIVGDQYKPPEPLDIRAFKHEAVGDAVYYRSQKDDPAFIDKGQQIDINSWRDEATRRATIQLSVAKWKDFNLTGSDEYKAEMVKTAVQMGLADRITNPELQDMIKLEQESHKLEQDKLRMMTKQQQEFDKYAKAVDADGYRVMAMKIFDDGSTKNFFFGDAGADKKPEAMPVDKVMRQIPRFQKWEQERGENIYYAPVSADKHHILMDDLSKDTLARFIEDGFKPAVLIQTSPNNYQAIITINKLSDDARVNSKVENRLIERLNKEYGDSVIQGPLHPHRAPAFHNLKPKHQRDDGSFPEVVLKKHEQRQCDKTKSIAEAMISDIEKDLARQQQAQVALSAKVKTVMRGSIDQAYHYFDAEVKKRFGDDQSKADVMVAVRLGAMGFSQSEVASAIASNSPLVRPTSEANKHDWSKYGERASSVAFNSQAHVMRDYSERYLDYWNKQLGWTVQEPKKAQEKSQSQGMDFS